VDAADYVVWRNGLDVSYTQADYDVWRANFGRTAGSGTSNNEAAVPEPCPLVWLLFAATVFRSARLRNGLVATA